MSQLPDPPVRILLVDDHTLFREGLRRMLDAEPGMQVCGDFASAAAAEKALAAGLRFDVALIDYELAGAGESFADGLELVAAIRQAYPEAHSLVVTAGLELADLVRAVQDLGAGIFLKTEPLAELMLAIRRTARGERWISSGAALELLTGQSAPSSPASAGRVSLTERESAVLRGVLEGLSNKEIGAQLGLSESAVKAVLQKLFEKTGVRSRSQLVRFAIESQAGGG